MYHATSVNKEKLKHGMMKVLLFHNHSMHTPEKYPYK
jgi:hypothetical protein